LLEDTLLQAPRLCHTTTPSALDALHAGLSHSHHSTTRSLIHSHSHLEETSILDVSMTMDESRLFAMAATPSDPAAEDAFRWGVALLHLSRVWDVEGERMDELRRALEDAKQCR